MNLRTYVYDSAKQAEHVPAVLDSLEAHPESVEYLDVAAVEDREDAVRRATLSVKEAVRIGSMPESLFDADGRPDFSPGALIVSDERGRRSLHVGADALEALRESE